MNRVVPIVSRTVLSGLLVSIMLAGCAVGPDYETPKPQLTPFHNATSGPASQGLAVPSLERWWTGFDDPLLVTVIQRALDENLDLAAAVARVSQARAVAIGAGAQLLPTVDLGASATGQHQSLRGPIGTIAKQSPGFKHDVYEVALGPLASWEIDLFGVYVGALRRHRMRLRRWKPSKLERA